MRLRKQLSLLALLFLLLPVASVLFIREVEQLLRLGQEQALMASARAVADRIRADGALVQQVASANDTLVTGQPLYAFADNAPITLDGYDDDWRFLKLRKQWFGAQPSRWSLNLLRQGGEVYGFLTVTDKQFDFHNPAVAFPASGDFVAIYAGGDQPRFLVMRNSAPGEMQTVYQARNGVVQPLHDARAVWREHAEGYQIEFKLPIDWLTTAATLGVYDYQRQTWSSNMGDAEIAAEKLLPQLSRWPIRAPVMQSVSLQAATDVFAHAGQRLRIVNLQQRVLADANRLHEITTPAPPMAWLVNRFINPQTLTDIEREEREAQLDTQEINQAITTKTYSSHWYRWNQSSNLVRVNLPVWDDSDTHVIGVIVAEQTTQQWLAISDRAFKRMLLYSLVAMVLLVSVLFLYATWLSVRIQSLSKAADSAVKEDGSINDHFPTTRMQDEIGDLQRGYGQLLARVGQYNDYLQTLASKLSHELRTPLAIVKSSLDNLDANAQTPAQAQYLARAQQGSQRLSAILNAMNSARRIEDAINQADIEPVDVAALVHQLGQAYDAMSADKHFCVKVVASDSPVWVQASADLLVQMLDKLFENAADFCTNQGSIKIGVEALAQSVKIWVENPGPYLPEHMSEQLFASMVSVRKENTDQPHLGLGLHIVKLIVDFHKGQLRVSNHPNYRGVVFEIVLPTIQSTAR